MATSMFVMFDNIEGECQDIGHKKWCEITSLSQSFENKAVPPPLNSTSNPVGTTFKPEAIAVKKIVDRASGELMRKCWECETLDKVVIECCRASGPPYSNEPIKYFTIELIDVTIKEFEFEVDEGDLVTEDLKLEADEATYIYTEMSKRGKALPFHEAPVNTGTAYGDEWEGLIIAGLSKRLVLTINGA